MDQQDLSTLLTKLLSETRETEWVEFTQNNADHQMIGEYLSALSNSVAIHQQ